MLALSAEETLDPPTADERPPRRPSEPLVPGERSELGDVIARGGMGEVITAHDADIGREVAIKRLRAPNPTPLALARFLREARIQGRLDHPAIVPVHELACDAEGRPFFAMKKLSGTALNTVLSAQPRKFTRHQLLRAFADVCLALEFAHTRGVIHRDIKPANIVLGDFGEVYVLDWGIARVPTDRAETFDTGPVPGSDDEVACVSTKPGSTLGTPGYMAPEQVRAEEVDARTDVYALGCVLYEILAGVPLHPRGKVKALCSALAGVDARPSLRVPDIAPELDDLCVRATELAPDDRIPSARELGESLQRYLDGDRDLALRGQLARDHLAIALAAGDDEEGRRVAMREAGQALALDPTLGGAAELIGRLMIEPPKQLPAQVEAEIAAADGATLRRFVFNVITMHAATLLMLPVIWLLGIHDAFYLGLMAVFSVIGLAAAVIDLRTKRDLTWVHNGVLFAGYALLARMFTPFLVVPVALAVNIVAFAFHPRGRHGRQLMIFAAFSLLALLGVWFCEAIGWLSPTMSFVDGRFTMHSPLDGIENFPVEYALVVYMIIGAVSSSSLAFMTARLTRSARERVHMQAWQMRQLVPDRRAE
ncbi:MAG TPA: serine/threonine-protein kinase [Kofleriaceae bacterium]